MQAVRPAAAEEEAHQAQAAQQEQAVREEAAAEVKREVAKAHEEEEAPEEKDVAVVGEEAETEGEAEAEAEGEGEAGVSAKKNRIQVSTNKKPLYFYVNLAKRYMQNYDEVELSALGMAIGTVVTVAEILKNNGLATEKSRASSWLWFFFLF
ncbi:hypothetical protein SEVIR_3G378500v4 [Setaria viridis]